MALQKETLKKMQAVYDMLSLAQAQERPIPLDEIGAVISHLEDIIRAESAATKIGKLDLFKYVEPDHDWPTSGIYHDPEGFIVATDQKVLAVIKSDISPDLSGKILMKDGSFYTGKEYPKWRMVVPSNEKDYEPVEIMSKAERITKFLDEQKARVKLSKETEYNGVHVHGFLFRPEFLLKTMVVMKEIGADSIYVRKDKEARAAYAKTDKGLVLLMPLMGSKDDFVIDNSTHLLDLDEE